MPNAANATVPAHAIVCPATRAIRSTLYVAVVVNVRQTLIAPIHCHVSVTSARTHALAPAANTPFAMWTIMCQNAHARQAWQGIRFSNAKKFPFHVCVQIRITWKKKKEKRSENISDLREIYKRELSSRLNSNHPHAFFTWVSNVFTSLFTCSAQFYALLIEILYFSPASPRNHPCNPSPCGPNSNCREHNGQAVCTCQPNYIGSPPQCRPECVVSSECPNDKACINNKCADPCPHTCGIDSVCHATNHNPICVCPSGFTGDPFSQCISEYICYTVEW